MSNDPQDLLRSAMREAADVMPDTDLYTTAFSRVSARVRRRRAAKATGLGAASLAVAAALAVGASTLAPDRTPVPPATPSVSPSPTPTPTPSVTPSPTPSPVDVPVQDGHAPGDLAELGLSCGMPTADLLTTADGYGVEVAGTVRADPSDPGQALLPVRILGPGSQVDLVGDPAAIWIHGGRVVTLQERFDPEPVSVPLGDSAALLDAPLRTPNTCQPPPGAEGATSDEPVGYTRMLPDGDYQVVVLAEPWLGGSPRVAAFSDPVAVRITGGVIEQPEVAGSAVPDLGGGARTWVDAEGPHVEFNAARAPDPSEYAMVRALCQAQSGEGVLAFEVRAYTTGDSFAIVTDGEVPCDGQELTGQEVTVDLSSTWYVAHPPEDARYLKIVLREVPDEVTFAYVVHDPGRP